MTMSIPEKIQKIEEAIGIIRSYQEELPQSLGDVENLENAAEPFDLSCLTPHLRAMNSLAPELPTMDPSLRAQVQETVTEFRKSLDSLLGAANQHKDEIVQETNKARGHNKSATAYLKAGNGAGN
tara:strand:- start:5150 stop:5524 length:375 start_codon:yes stop_codon:yes gene_type:complete